MKSKSFDDHIKDPVVSEHPLLQGYKTLDSFRNLMEKRSMELKAYQESLTADDLRDIFMSNHDSHYKDATFSQREMVYEASSVLHDTLVQFDLPMIPKVNFLRVRDAKTAKNDATRLVSGVVMFDVELTSLTNVRKHATMPVNVIGGEAVPPSVMEVDGQLYVVAQDAFDFIIERITSYELPELRTMFEPPMTAEEREQAVALRNAMGWQPRRNDGYLMQPTEKQRLRNYTTPSRTAVKSTPPGFKAVLAELEDAEKNGDDTFPRTWEYIRRNYIMNHVNTASKDAWMPHLMNKGFVINPYGPTNRGRKSGAKEAQMSNDIFPPENPEVISALGNFVGHDHQIQQIYEDWTSGDSVDVQDLDEAVAKLEQLYQSAGSTGDLDMARGIGELVQELEAMIPKNPNVQASKQAQGFPEDLLEDPKEELKEEPMEKEIEMEVTDEPEQMEEVIEALLKYYPGTKTPIEREDKVKFNGCGKGKGQRGCIVDVDADNDFLIVRSQGMEYRVKVEDVEPLPGTFKKMYM